MYDHSTKARREQVELSWRSYTIHKVVLHHLKEDYNMLKKYTVLLLLVKWTKGVTFTILSGRTKISDKIYETMALKALDISQ